MEIKLGILLISIVAAPQIFAQSGWQQIAAEALRNNSKLKSSGFGIEQKDYSRKQVVSEFLPQITLSGQHGTTETEVQSLKTIKRGDEFGVLVSLPLFDGFGSRSRYIKNKNLRQQAEQDKHLTEAELRYQLRQIYFSLLVTRQRLVLERKVLTRLDTNFGLIRLKYKNGAEAKWSMDVVEADRLTSQQRLENLQTQQAGLVQSIRELVQNPTFSPQFEGDSISSYLTPPVKFQFNISKHPQYLAQSHLTTASDYARTEARSGFYPSLAAVAEYTETQVRGSDPAKKETFYGMTLTWNIFDGMSTWYKTQAAGSEFQRNKMLQQALAYDLTRVARETWEKYHRSFKLVKPAEDRLKAAQLREQTVTKQYRNGLKPYLDWEKALSHLTDAEQNEIDSKDRALRALAELEKARGKTFGGRDG